MQDYLMEHYLLLKALHIISVISFMAGILYLPRLFIYHTMAAKGSEMSETFKVMERKLLRIIINPASVSMTLFGGLMFWANPALFESGWVHAKIFLLVLLFGVHGLYSRWRKQFERDENTRSDKFYRVWNEIPTVLMIVIVLLAVIKPF